jgi:hypothetical protein
MIYIDVLNWWCDMGFKPGSESLVALCAAKLAFDTDQTDIFNWWCDMYQNGSCLL